MADQNLHLGVLSVRRARYSAAASWLSSDDGIVLGAIKVRVKPAGKDLPVFRYFHRLRKGLKFFNFDIAEAPCFNKEIHQTARQRLDVSRIVIEVLRSHQNVSRIWCFQY